MNRRRSVPVVLTIAGSDSSAGAGIQADLKTFAAWGVYGVCAVTCIVSETPGKVSQIQPARPGMVRDQVSLLLKSFPVAAIKTGLLCNEEIATTVAGALRKLKPANLVVDPVMVATSGDALLAQKAIAIYERELFPLATLITPNLDEASRLLGCEITRVASMAGAARELARKYRTRVLLKGGHLRGARAIDVFSDGIVVREFASPYIRNVHTHGTGCTCSAAIAAGLARGLSLPEAITKAKRYVTAAIRSHLAWKSGGALMIALNHSRGMAADRAR